MAASVTTPRVEPSYDRNGKRRMTRFLFFLLSGVGYFHWLLLEATFFLLWSVCDEMRSSVSLIYGIVLESGGRVVEVDCGSTGLVASGSLLQHGAMPS